MLNLGILTGLIIAAVEVVKRGKFIDKKYLPIVAVVFSLVLVFITRHIGEGNSEAIIQALVAAFSAVGLYSGTKSVLKK